MPAGFGTAAAPTGGQGVSFGQGGYGPEAFRPRQMRPRPQPQGNAWGFYGQRPPQAHGGMPQGYLGPPATAPTETAPARTVLPTPMPAQPVPQVPQTGAMFANQQAVQNAPLPPQDQFTQQFGQSPAARPRPSWLQPGGYGQGYGLG